MHRRNDILDEESAGRSDNREWTSPELRETEIAWQTENDFTSNSDGGLPS